MRNFIVIRLLHRMHLTGVPYLAKFFFPGAIFRIQPGNKKTVYLTFDDGPHPLATPAVLDILKKNNIKATFFCIGENIVKYPELIERIIAEGHALGNHSFNHIDGFKKPVEEYYENVKKCAEIVKTKIFRPPYGRITLRQYKRLKKEFTIIFWNVMSKDYDAESSAERCFNRVKKYTKPGSIIDFHDSEMTKDKIPFLLQKTIEFLLKEGYQPETITNQE